MISISKISKELNIQPYQLRDWEKRGWLGADPILKDPENNNQRIYNEHQVERIHFIQKELQRQRQEGIKRTDVSEMNSKLLDQFGGEVVKIDKNELTVHSSSVEEMAKLIIDLSKKVSNLEEQLMSMHNKVDQLTLNQKEEKERIEERDKLLMESLKQTLDSKKESAATDMKKSWWAKFKRK